MTFTVYGIRLRGEMEARYVGQTAKAARQRLTSLCGEHSCKWDKEWHCDSFGIWLRSNAGNLEAFEIAKCATREEAKATERVVIAICLRLGHRLFNGDHVPSHLRRASGRHLRLAA